MSFFDMKPKVIWAKEIHRDFDQYVAFRREFTIPYETTIEFNVFANTYYNLYVDGNFIHRGPVRKHEKCAEYDKLNVRLMAGTHTVAVLVHWLGIEVPAHRMGKPAFWLCAQGKDISFVTDSSWKSKFLTAFLNNDSQLMGCYDFREEVDMREYPEGWTEIGYNASEWDDAEEYYEVGSSLDYCTKYILRQMKLFSYSWEKGTIIKRGHYTENKPSDTYFFERMISRLRGNNGNDGSFAVAEFEMTVSGTLSVEYKGCKNGAELIIGYDDMLDDNGFPKPDRFTRYGDRFILSEGDGRIEIFMPRGFKYALIELSGNGVIEKVSVRKEEYPYLPTEITVGDTFFDSLYKQCLRTQHICTIDGYTDCVNRERVLWLGDAWIDTMSAYYAEPDKGLLLTTIYEHAMGQVEKGAICGYNSSDLQPDWLHMPSYNMMYLHMLCDYILFTGRTDDIIPLKDTAKGILRFISNNMSPDGLCELNDFWDWGGASAEGQQLKTSAFFIYTVERMLKFMELRDIAEPYRAIAENMRKSCRKIFWSEDRGVFLDACVYGEAPDPLCTQIGNALAVLADICPYEYQNRLMERILTPTELDKIPIGENMDGTQFTFDKSKISPPGTMFTALFVAMTLFEKNREDLAIPYMRDVWGTYKGMQTLPELRFNGPNNTVCHGWSGGPGYLIPRYILGLYPDEYGWKTVTLVPPSVSADELPSAGGRITTPFGILTVQWTRDDDHLKVTADIPDGITLRVLWKKQKFEFTENTCIYII